MLPVRSRPRPAVAALQAASPASLPPATPAAKDPLNWVRRLSLAIEPQPVAGLRPARRNARTHSNKQIHQIAASIRRFGFINPIVIDEEGRIEEAVPV